jgi:hypothetical protein
MRVGPNRWIPWLWLLWVAGCTPGGEDARFVPLGDAVVRDVRTGLEWVRRDDGVGRDWDGADAYCRSLSIGEMQGWRLPAIDELRGLYGTADRIPCGEATCAIDPAFGLTSPYVWSATAPGANARTYLDFQFGTELSPSITPRLVRRALCVRTPPAR